MKKVLPIFLVTLFVGCISSLQIDDSLSISLYRIKKIEDMNSLFVITAQRNDSLFRIISTKDDKLMDGTEIQEGKMYPLKLKKIFPVDSISRYPVALNLGISIGLTDKYSEPLQKRFHNTIYTSLNLRGLYIE